MKWILNLRPKHPQLESNNTIHVSESPEPKHGYFAEFIRDLEKKDDWDEINGKFRIFSHGRGRVVIELDTGKKLPPFTTIDMA